MSKEEDGVSGPVVEVIVPWTPPSRMSPNAGAPKRSWDRWKNQGRDIAALAIADAYPGGAYPPLWPPYRIVYHVHWGKGRKSNWDKDNLKSCFKGVRDSFERKGVIVNDRDIIEDDVIQGRDPAGAGFVRVVISEAGA